MTELRHFVQNIVNNQRPALINYQTLATNSEIKMKGLTPAQTHKLDYVTKMFDNVLMDRKDHQDLLHIVLNDITEENSRDRVTLMSLIMDDSMTGRNFELVASLGVEVLVHSVNYMNMRARVQEAILEGK